MPTLLREGHFWPSGCLYGTRCDSKVNILARHSWPIFGPLGPLWWPQKGNFMSKLIPFVAPNSHKSSLLALEEIIIWPKIIKFGPKCQMMLHLGGHQRCNAFWTLYMEFWPFEGFQMDLFVYKMASWGHLNEPQWFKNGSLWAIWWSFQGPKGWFFDYWGLQRGSVCSWNCPFGASKRDPVVQKWISYASPVMSGQYVDFGIKSGAIKTSRGSKVPFTE